MYSHLFARETQALYYRFSISLEYPFSMMLRIVPFSSTVFYGEAEEENEVVTRDGPCWFPGSHGNVVPRPPLGYPRPPRPRAAVRTAGGASLRLSPASRVAVCGGRRARKLPFKALRPMISTTPFVGPRSELIIKTG